MEMLRVDMTNQPIQTTDLDGRPCRAAGRGGLGTVMGSKGLKAILVENNGNSPAPLASKADFMTALDAYAKGSELEKAVGNGPNTQIHMAEVDTAGICDFAQSGLASPEGINNVYRMMSAKSGKPFGKEDWTNLGIQVLKTELEFNKRARFANKDDRLPPMFYN